MPKPVTDKTATDKAKRDPQRTKARILAAATTEFARNGLGGARVDRIAARARSNERMLYYYFDSKDKLFVAVLEEAYLAFWRAEAKLTLDHLDPVAGISRLVEFIWTTTSRILRSSGCSTRKTSIRPNS